MNEVNSLQANLNGTVSLMVDTMSSMVKIMLVSIGNIVGIAITVFTCILFAKIFRAIIMLVYDFSRGTIFIDKNKFTFLSSSYYFGIHR